MTNREKQRRFYKQHREEILKRKKNSYGHHRRQKTVRSPKHYYEQLLQQNGSGLPDTGQEGDELTFRFRKGSHQTDLAFPLNATAIEGNFTNFIYRYALPNPPNPFCFWLRNPKRGPRYVYVKVRVLSVKRGLRYKYHVSLKP